MNTATSRTFDFPISDKPCGEDEVLPVNSRTPAVKYASFEEVQQADLLRTRSKERLHVSEFTSFAVSGRSSGRRP